MSGVAEVIFVVLLGYFLVLNGLYLAITVGAFASLRRQRALRYVDLSRLARSATTLPVSVLVPAYNEEAVLEQVIKSILGSEYPEFELIVVNDGSVDGTAASATREFDLVACEVFHPGCGAWPKRLLLELGGFSTAVTHYDIEATVHANATLRPGKTTYRIVAVPDAVVYTQVPTSWRDLLSQRKRWQRVVYEMIRDYRRLILNPRYGYFGLIGMPYLLLFEGIGPFVEAFSYAFVIVLAIAGELSAGSLALYFCFSFGLTALIRIVSLFADVFYFRAYPRRSIATLTLLALVEAIVFHLAQLPHRVLGFIEFLRGRRTHETMTREPFTRRAGARSTESPA